MVRVKRLPVTFPSKARCKRGKINFDIYEVIPASYWAIMSNIKVIFTLSYVAIFPKAALQPLPAAATFLSIQISIFSTPYTTTIELYRYDSLTQHTEAKVFASRYTDRQCQHSTHAAFFPSLTEL